jgi:ribosomal protein S12 methylthiotransferase accessory factor YcaO
MTLKAEGKIRTLQGATIEALMEYVERKGGKH